MGGHVCAKSTLSEYRGIYSQELKTSVPIVIPAQLLRHNIDQIIEAFIVLLNISLSTASMHGLKGSIFKPLFKKSGLDQEILSNFRPVANMLYLTFLVN